MEKTKNKYQTANNSKVPILNIVVCCLFVFCCLLFVVSPAAADPNPTGKFLPFYWIKGQVKTKDGSPLADKLQGRDIYLHGLSFDENDVIKVKVDAEGFFRVNAGQLYYWHSNNVYYDENNLPIFLLSIVKKDDAQWGAFAVVQPDYNKAGYVIADLTLAPNGGPKVGKGMAVGIAQSAIGPLDQIPISLPDPYGPKKSNDNGAAIWFEVNAGDYTMTCDPVGFEHIPPSTPTQACPVTADHITIVKYQLEGTLISGSVDISIVKVDTNADGIDDSIKLNWIPLKPDSGEQIVYLLMVGDGTGVFNNDLSKVEVYTQNSLDSFKYDDDKGKWLVFTEDGGKNPAEVLNINMDGDITKGEAIFKDQVNGKAAAGKNYFAEMYFRFIKIQGQGAPDLTNPALLQAFANAKAVGKVDETLQLGWNLLAIPFDTSDGNADQVLGSYNFGLGDMLWLYTDKFTSTSFNTATNKWSNAANFVLSGGKGFWLKKESIDPAKTTLTVVGRVINSYSSNLPQGWSLIGNPFVSSYASLDNAGFASLSGDMVWEYTDKFNSVSKGLPAWTNMSLKLAKGYWYKREGALGMTWQPVPNY